MNQVLGYPNTLPQFMIFSGCKLPWEYADNNLIYTESNLYKYLIDVIKLPEPIKNDNAILSSIIKDLKNDYDLFKRYKNSNIQIKCSGYIFSGEQDKLVSNKNIQAWERVFTSKPQYYSFPGTHMFINENKDQVCKTINKIIEENILETMNEF